eukprot:gene19213-22967_t
MPPLQSDSEIDSDLTNILSSAAMGLKFQHLPEEVLEVSKHCLLDFLGCTISGADEPLTRTLMEQAAAEGGPAQATVIGDGRRVNASQAALINGSASHALDYDDVHSRLHGHPTVPVAPAVLALAEAMPGGASGAEILTAFAAGVEVECRVGAYVGMPHYEKGFHNTATLGTFGAAAAAARMLQLSTEDCATALGIAGTSAAGLKSMFGTMCKPLHAGRAAQNGLVAAQLAARGFGSRRDVLEAPQGFVDAHAGSSDLPAALYGLGERFEVRATLFKYHAACYGTHAAIEAISALRARHPVLQVAGAECVISVTVTVQTPFLAVCDIPTPATGLEGKFSLRYCAALALTGEDTSAAESFSDARVGDPGLRALLERVTVVGSDALEKMEAEVAVTFTDGGDSPTATTVRASHDAGVPAADDELPAQWTKLARKFRALTEPALGAEGAETAIEAISTLERASAADVAALIRLLRRRPADSGSDRRRRGLVVMDGATGSQLFRHGVPRSETSWSADSLADPRHHEAVVKVHESYLEAGAKIITTANYAVQPTNYRRAYPPSSEGRLLQLVAPGLFTPHTVGGELSWREQMTRHTTVAAHLALRARNGSLASAGARVFGCLPPLSESHRPDLAMKLREEEGVMFCVRSYAAIADALQAGGAIDGFLIETANTLDDVECALEAVAHRGLPIIVSVEGALRSPENLAPRPEMAPAVAERVLKLKRDYGIPIEAFGFNCAPPEVILESLEAVRAAGLDRRLREEGVALVAYANIVDHGDLGHDQGFDQGAVTRKLAQSGRQTRTRKDMVGAKYVEFCHRFLESGATYCGGCCECTPEQIRMLSTSVDRATAAGPVAGSVPQNDGSH